MVDCEAADGARRLHLAHKLDLRGSEALAQALLEAEGNAVTIDAAQVDLLGAHALQTLIVAHNAWQEAGLAFTIDPVSPAMADALTTLGVTSCAVGATGAP
ncbi:MAG: STAS domain-containing protein [Pseudomonadota bacterium]